MSRLAVSTGGSGGIGRAVAARLLATSHRTLLTGRNRSALEEAAAVNGQTIVLDRGGILS